MSHSCTPPGCHLSHVFPKIDLAAIPPASICAVLAHPYTTSFTSLTSLIFFTSHFPHFSSPFRRNLCSYTSLTPSHNYHSLTPTPVSHLTLHFLHLASRINSCLSLVILLTFSFFPSLSNDSRLSLRFPSSHPPFSLSSVITQLSNLSIQYNQSTHSLGVNHSPPSSIPHPSSLHPFTTSISCLSPPASSSSEV